MLKSILITKEEEEFFKLLVDRHSRLISENEGVKVEIINIFNS